LCHISAAFFFNSAQRTAEFLVFLAFIYCNKFYVIFIQGTNIAYGGREPCDCGEGGARLWEKYAGTTVYNGTLGGITARCTL
jgi:hypothetical protein